METTLPNLNQQAKISEAISNSLSQFSNSDLYSEALICEIHLDQELEVDRGENFYSICQSIVEPDLDEELSKMWFELQEEGSTEIALKAINFQHPALKDILTIARYIDTMGY